MRPAVAWAAGIALIVAAWGVALVSPDEDAAQAPFVVPVGIGQTGTGRAIEATVTAVRLADGVTGPRGWQADGAWVVVDLDVAGASGRTGHRLEHAVLEVDGLRYRATERADTLLETALIPGVARSGSIAFELPPDARTGTAVLSLGVLADERLDSLIELTIDLDALEVDDDVALTATGWAAP